MGRRGAELTFPVIINGIDFLQLNNNITELPRKCFIILLLPLRPFQPCTITKTAHVS